jgi:HPr kinase/phosphorylase
MIAMNSVLLSTLVNDFKLEVVCASEDYDKVRLTVEDVSRPGLQIAGYFDHFEPMRLQVVGNAEASYISRMEEVQKLSIFDRLFAYKFPALLIARGITPDPVCLEMAKKHNVTVLATKEPTSTIVSDIIAYLKAALAPQTTSHGVLMEVYGEGILILGDSGIGKSETAVELLKRGHRLIADDAVEIRKISDTCVVGTAPALIQNYIELRGIGIVNVAKLFGMGAVKADNEINLVVRVVPWEQNQKYDRIGLEEKYEEILGVRIPVNTIPVSPGRNLAVILEVAAMNNRQRKMGYNPALEFTENADRHAQQKKEDMAK